MTTVVLLNDVMLGNAAARLSEASSLMTSENEPMPALGLPTITVVNAEILAFAQALDLARLALADAASTASQATLQLQSTSTALDAELAGAILDDFAVPEAAGVTS